MLAMIWSQKFGSNSPAMGSCCSREVATKRVRCWVRQQPGLSLLSRSTHSAPGLLFGLERGSTGTAVPEHRPSPETVLPPLGTPTDGRAGYGGQRLVMLCRDTLLQGINIYFFPCCSAMSKQLWPFTLSSFPASCPFLSGFFPDSLFLSSVWAPAKQQLQGIMLLSCHGQEMGWDFP